SNLVEGEGFEPSKAEPSDLQSDPFDRSGTPPNEARDYGGNPEHCQTSSRGICTVPRRIDRSETPGHQGEETSGPKSASKPDEAVNGSVLRSSPCMSCFKAWRMVVRVRSCSRAS